MHYYRQPHRKNLLLHDTIQRLTCEDICVNVGLVTTVAKCNTKPRADLQSELPQAFHS